MNSRAQRQAPEDGSGQGAEVARPWKRQQTTLWHTAAPEALGRLTGGAGPAPCVAIVEGDNLLALREVPDGVVNLLYIDPAFNTGQPRRSAAPRQSGTPMGTGRVSRQALQDDA